MSGCFVLDVPEFRALTRVAADNPVCIVHSAIGSYRYVSFTGANDIVRADTGLSEAVWFGRLTGGLDGTIARFDSEVIRIVETHAPV